MLSNVQWSFLWVEVFFALCLTYHTNQSSGGNNTHTHTTHNVKSVRLHHRSGENTGTGIVFIWKVTSTKINQSIKTFLLVLLFVSTVILCVEAMPFPALFSDSWMCESWFPTNTFTCCEVMAGCWDWLGAILLYMHEPFRKGWLFVKAEVIQRPFPCMHGGGLSMTSQQPALPDVWPLSFLEYQETFVLKLLVGLFEANCVTIEHLWMKFLGFNYSAL